MNSCGPLDHNDSNTAVEVARRASAGKARAQPGRRHRGCGAFAAAQQGCSSQEAKLDKQAAAREQATAASTAAVGKQATAAGKKAAAKQAPAGSRKRKAATVSPPAGPPAAKAAKKAGRSAGAAAAAHVIAMY